LLWCSCPSRSPILEQQRAAVLRQISELQDFRAGSITGTGDRCGNPGCHCYHPGDPGHRPHPRLTYKVNGKTITESFATPAEQRMAEREIETFRRYRQLERSFVDVNEKIYRARPQEDTLPRVGRKTAEAIHAQITRSNQTAEPHLRGAQAGRWHGSGGGVDGPSLTNPPSSTGSLNSSTAVNLANGLSAEMFDGRIGPTVLNTGSAPGLLCGIVQINMTVPTYANPGAYECFPCPSGRCPAAKPAPQGTHDLCQVATA
jgi:hypothetical protein